MKKATDERVLAQKRKIGSDACQLLTLGLLASVVIQQFLFHAPLSQYIVEFILFIAASLYIVICNIMVGNDLYDSAKDSPRLMVINSLVCGLTIAAVNGVLNYTQAGNAFNVLFLAVVTFLCATIGSFVVLKLLSLAIRKKQKSIEDRLNAEE